LRISPNLLAIPISFAGFDARSFTLRWSVRSGVFVPLRYVPAGSGTDQA